MMYRRFRMWVCIQSNSNSNNNNCNNFDKKNIIQDLRKNNELKNTIFLEQENEREKELVKQKLSKELNNDEWEFDNQVMRQTVVFKKEEVMTNKTPVIESKNPSQHFHEAKVKVYDLNKGIYDDPTMHIRKGVRTQSLVLENVKFLNKDEGDDQSLAMKLKEAIDQQNNNLKKKSAYQELLQSLNNEKNQLASIIKDSKDSKDLIEKKVNELDNSLIIVQREKVENKNNNSTTGNKSITGNETIKSSIYNNSVNISNPPKPENVNKMVTGISRGVRDRTPQPQSTSSAKLEFNPENQEQIPDPTFKNKELKQSNDRVIMQNGRKFNVVKKVFGSEEASWEFVMKVPNKLVQGNQGESNNVTKSDINEKIEKHDSNKKKHVTFEQSINNNNEIHVSKNSNNYQFNLANKNMISIVKDDHVIDIPENKFRLAKDSHHMHVQSTFKFEQKTILGDDHHMPLAMKADNTVINDNLNVSNINIHTKFHNHKKEKIEENLNIGVDPSVINDKNYIKPQQPIDESILFNTSQMTAVDKMPKIEVEEEDFNRTVQNMSSIMIGNYSMLDLDEKWDEDVIGDEYREY
jgi:hypothetical protein